MVSLCVSALQCLWHRVGFSLRVKRWGCAVSEGLSQVNKVRCIHLFPGLSYMDTSRFLRVSFLHPQPYEASASLVSFLGLRGSYHFPCLILDINEA